MDYTFRYAPSLSIPDAVGGNTITATIEFPDSEDWLAAIRGALYNLAEPEMWASDSLNRASLDAAERIDMSLQDYALEGHVHEGYTPRFVGARVANNLSNVDSGVEIALQLVLFGNPSLASLNPTERALKILAAGKYRLLVSQTVSTGGGAGATEIRVKSATGGIWIDIRDSQVGLRRLSGDNLITYFVGDELFPTLKFPVASNNIYNNSTLGYIILLEYLGQSL